MGMKMKLAKYATQMQVERDEDNKYLNAMERATYQVRYYFE
jgi:hypothetical protein